MLAGDESATTAGLWQGFQGVLKYGGQGFLEAGGTEAGEQVGLAKN